MTTREIAALEERLEHERHARLEAERIADETIRDLHERQCAIQLVRAVAFAANDARSIDEAMRAALEAVCRYAGWSVGHVFFVDERGQLLDSDIWHDESGRFEPFRRRTAATTFAPGMGVPGTVLAQRLTVWVEDLRDLQAVLPARQAERFGLRAAVGVPVFVGTRVRAVLELFGEATRELDGQFVDLLGQVGTILGRVIEREESQRDLHEANERLTQALVDLQQAQDHIVQQERLRALGHMASGIAHDFNNALHPIVGYAELLLEQRAIAGLPQASRYLRNILTSATDAAAVVARLREFYRSRGDDEVMAPVDLGAIVTQVADLTRPRWHNESLAAGITIAVITDLGPVPAILGHEAQLREALINLVINAVDAMPEGGTIVLRTRALDGRVFVEVCDGGVGMTDEVRRQCLEPFFTTKGDRGSGLGLGMVYGITQRHDATLDIASVPGIGTTVTLGFPEAATRAQPELAPAAADVPPLRILLVDDQPVARDIVQALLEADGHVVATTSNGLEALARLEAQCFDLVITDRSMPGMSGDELARAVKTSATPLPVIMVTGFAVLMASSGERPVGVDLVLPKPLTRDALRRAVAMACPAINSAV